MQARRGPRPGGEGGGCKRVAAPGQAGRGPPLFRHFAPLPARNPMLARQDRVVDKKPSVTPTAAFHFVARVQFPQGGGHPQAQKSLFGPR